MIHDAKPKEPMIKKQIHIHRGPHCDDGEELLRASRVRNENVMMEGKQANGIK